MPELTHKERVNNPGYLARETLLQVIRYFFKLVPERMVLYI